ncbi:MAG: hypothetical protein RL434_239 [Pseudomonadota bacterium]|jgi:ketosteroid isomerase-like protein
MNPDFRKLFAAVDAMDSSAFGAFLSEDAQFRFGNLPVVIGREAITGFLDAWFPSIAAIRHEDLAMRDFGDTVLVEGRVTYTRKDATELSVPFANVFDMVGGSIRGYRIYVDNSGLYPGR